MVQKLKIMLEDLTDGLTNVGFEGNRTEYWAMSLNMIPMLLTKRNT